MSEAVKRKNLTLIKWIVVFALPIIMLCLPTNDVFTWNIKAFVAITLWAILLFIFELIPTGLTALLLMLLYVIFGVCDFTLAFKGWTQSVIWQGFGCFMLINIVNKGHLLERLGYKFCILMGGTYLGIIYGIFAIATVFSILIPGPSTGIIIIAFGYGICKALKLPKGKASGGIMLATVIGFTEASHFVYNPLSHGLMAGLLASITDVELNFVNVFLYNACFIPLTIFLGWWLSKAMKPEVEIKGKDQFRKMLADVPPMDSKEKKTLAVILVMVAFFVLQPLHNLDMTYGFLLAPCILFFPGFNIADKEDLQGVPWNLMLFLTGCLAIGNVGGELGIGQIISDIALPYLQGQGPLVFTLLCFFIGVVANFAMTPSAFITVLTVPICSIALSLGYSCYPVIFAFTQASDALIFPYEQTTMLVCFGFGMILFKDFMRVFGQKMLFTTIYLACIGVPYWLFLGII